MVTGGGAFQNEVKVYDIDGWVENLPFLNEGRRFHGCGHYVDSFDNIVSLCIVILYYILHNPDLLELPGYRWHIFPRIWFSLN